ncbi:MAG: ornithine/acetylornithine aminotransferase [Acidimicrobiaceae bacterium]|nr:ornithine/acetylornithine aminotransferase [Acidimicrobiaceae bacterium]
MGFDLREVLNARRGENFQLYSRNINPQLVRVLRSIGFDRFYERGEGAYLYDRDGERYLDFLAGFGTFALGRAHPVLKKALHDAIDADLPNLVQMDAALLPGVLAEELLRRCHSGMGRVFFTNSGTEAVEAALKFVRSATRRSRVLDCDHAFHGLTYGSLSLNGGSDFRKGFGPLLPGFDQVRFGDAEALERALSSRDVAALVIEPIQGKGVNIATQAYWDSVQELCRRYGTLLVVDEVQTGLGRTGRLWAHEHYGLVPDVITVSKALSGGFVPVGAMICSERVANTVYSSMERAMVHSSTFKNNQLAMVAGLATLQTIDDEGLVDRARLTGLAFEKALAPLVDRYELLHEVRGKGLMIGLVFGRPESLRLRARFLALEAAHTGLFSQTIVVPLFERHRILTQVAGDGMNVVKILPPLICGQEEVDAFVAALDDVLEDAHRGSSLVWGFARTLARASVQRDR